MAPVAGRPALLFRVTLAAQGVVQQQIAESRLEIEQARGVDPASVVRLWTELTETERQGLPILAVMTSDSDVPAAVAVSDHVVA